MTQFKKILVPVDFSGLSEKAFFAAVDLAKELNASLHVVHIVQIHSTNIPESGMVHFEELQKKEEANAKTKLDKYIENNGGGLDISTTILHGDPAAQINKTVKETGADMIIMGTHGRTGMAHLLMGSVAESVLRNSKVPVMCIKGDPGQS